MRSQSATAQLGLALLILAAGASAPPVRAQAIAAPKAATSSTPSIKSNSSAASTPTPAQAETLRLILEGARKEAAKGTPYIEDYKYIPYPGGDVPEGTGVCTDLVVRAFRNAGLDLQKLIHEDRAAHPEAYPTQIWDRKTPDPNIDHRRCQNTVTWFKRHTDSLTTDLAPEALLEWRGGDVVFWTRHKGDFPWHVGIVSDKRDDAGKPYVVDSFPPRTSETHPVDIFGMIHSHYRVPEGGPKLRAIKRTEPRAASKPKASPGR